MTEIDVQPHPFDTAVALTPVADGRWQGRTSPAYANMVGPFGGVTAATLLRAAELHPDRLGDPLSLTVNYAGPVTDGEFEVTARPVRTNRTTQHWLLELTQDGAVTTTATAIFGVRRDTWSDTEAEMPKVPAPEDTPLGGFPDFISWAANYEMRYVEGELPTDSTGESPSSTTTLWVRDSPSRPLDYASLTALSDVFYPRVFLRRGQFIPAGTVSLTTYFHTTPATLTSHGTTPLLATARSTTFTSGYHDQSAHLWTPTGTLLATTHQLVYYKH
ncbi:thioesterase family protein [Actinocorallia lasiicapitis]